MKRAISTIRAFLATEASGGVLLMAAAALALVIANSPMAPNYFHALHLQLGGMSVEHWINDGLMAVFFLLVGLEIKREALEGELSTWSQRALPGLAALGGMIAPALIYVALNLGSPQTLRGWAIPAATDIAFALGVLSLMGSGRVPASLKIFLAALAIIDDLGAIVIIALFYTSSLTVWALLAAFGVLAVLVVLNRMKVVSLVPYLALGLLLWWLLLKSGVHATLAGVALALTIPLTGKAEAPSPLHRLEHGLHPWVAFLIVPIFGFANAGVNLGAAGLSALTAPSVLGVGLGLFLGKQLGVFGASALAIRFWGVKLPTGANWAQLYGVALLCGVGFTMSLFINNLAFASAALREETKLGVLAGSLLSALAGWAVMALAARRRGASR